MLNTGFISFITEAGGGQDSQGNPLPVIKTNSDYYPCSLKTVQSEYKLLVDGQYLQAKYTAIIDNFEFTGTPTFTEVQLQDSQQNNLGVHQVHKLDYFSFTNKLKVVV